MTVAIQSLGTFHFIFPEDEWTGSFNGYGVWGSRFGEAGPYEALHSPGHSAAAFLIPARAGYDVDGLVLELLVNRTVEVHITFSGTTPAEVVDSINAAMPSVIKASQDGGGVLVETFEVGHQASILATESDAWTKLHQTGTCFFGLSTYPALVPGTESYQFLDPSAEEGWYYRTRYAHRGTGELSAYSIPVPARVNVGVDRALLIKGEVYLTTPSGAPVQNVLVLLDVPADPTMPGMVPQQIKGFSNADGYVGIMVRRGVEAVLSIAGSNVTRRIQVPSTGDTFDLADPSLSIQPDAYRVQVPDTKVGERRSM